MSEQPPKIFILYAKMIKAQNQHAEKSTAKSFVDAQRAKFRVVQELARLTPEIKQYYEFLVDAVSSVIVAQDNYDNHVAGKLHYQPSLYEEERLRLLEIWKEAEEIAAERLNDTWPDLLRNESDDEVQTTLF